MQRRFRGVLLDVDGTLVDSNDQHAHAWVEALAHYDIDVAYGRARRMIGMGGDKLIEAVTGLPPDSKKSKAIAERRGKIFRETWLPTIKPLLGARDLVLRLRAEGYLYVIASAAQGPELAPLLEIANVADLCAEELRTSSAEVEHSKPAPDIVHAALAKLPVECSQAVMIGDTPYDVRAAREAYVACIGVASGGWPPEGLAGALAVFHGPADLVAQWALSPLAAGDEEAAHVARAR